MIQESMDEPHKASSTREENVSKPDYVRKISVSEALEDSTPGLSAPKWLSWVEVPFHVVNPDTGKMLPEACGWSMSSCARGPLNLVSSYVGGAILRMAVKEAGGPNNVIRGFGLKPSSLLTATSAIIGVVAAILMPVMGAIVDHTSYRRQVGIVSGFFAVILVGAQVAIDDEKNNWLPILIIDAIQSFALLVQITASFAYLPDLSTDAHVASHYTSRFNLRQYSVQFFYISILILSTIIRGNKNKRDVVSSVATARDAAGMSFGIGMFFMAYAWTFCFRDRAPLSNVPEGSSLLTAGFVQVYKTSIRIWKDYHALKWFLISLLISPEAGAGVVLRIAITYVTVVVRFSVFDIAKGTLILMLSSIVGSFFAKFANRKFNALNSYRISMTLFGVSLGVGSWLLRGPQHRARVYLLTIAWGFFLGWTYPAQRVLFCTLIPRGQETEMMGMFTFAGQILGWLLPLVVTVFNEKDVDMRWSLTVVFFFCFVAILLTLPMGSYVRACEIVENEWQQKFHSGRVTDVESSAGVVVLETFHEHQEECPSKEASNSKSDK